MRRAADRQITIVPEIETPGHALAALSVYPELSCTGGPFEVETQWGIHADVFCAGNEATFTYRGDLSLESVTGPEGATTEVEYDIQGNPRRSRACTVLQQPGSEPNKSLERTPTSRSTRPGKSTHHPVLQLAPRAERGVAQLFVKRARN